MTPRRRSPKRTPRAASANGGEPYGILLEEVRSQMNVVIELVQDCAKARDVAARFDAVDARFDAVDARFDALTAEVRRKADGARLVALEQRVTALERRTGA